MRKKRSKLRHFYYSIGIELETFIAADYPATAYETLHSVFHRLLEHLDNHHFPRVCCNLVADVTAWKIQPLLSSVGRLNHKNLVKWPPFREKTFMAKAGKKKWISVQKKSQSESSFGRPIRTRRTNG